VLACWVDPIPLSLQQQRGVECVLLTLDVEGAELAILSTLDFTAIRVEVILVECNPRKTANEVGRFLEAQDFVLVEPLGVDRLFIHAQSPWSPAALWAAQQASATVSPSRSSGPQRLDRKSVAHQASRRQNC
jgi:hypothetical protein